MKFPVILFYLFINFFIHNIICNDAQQLIKTFKTENDVISNITDFYSQNEKILIDKKTSLKIKELLLEKKYYTSLSLYFYITNSSDLKYTNNTKEIIQLSPFFEFAQNHSHIYVKIKFGKINQFTDENYPKHLFINLRKTNLIVSCFEEREKNIIWYYRNLNLFSIAKKNSLSIQKETNHQYLIFFEKGIYTMYWDYLDLITDEHHNIISWIEMADKYERKVKFNEYHDWVQDKLLIDDIDKFNEKKDSEIKLREKKLEKLKERKKKRDNCCPIIKKEKCRSDNIYDWNYWVN